MEVSRSPENVEHAKELKEPEQRAEEAPYSKPEISDLEEIRSICITFYQT